MSNNGGEKKKSLLRALTAEKLTEMLKEIDVSAVKGKEGEFSARARITALFDHGTFSEIGTYMNRSSDPDEAEGVICGYGAVDGRLTFAFAQDRNRMNGAFDEVAGKKIDALYAMAVKNGAAVVGIFDSDGTCVYEGVKAMSALGRTLGASARAAGIVPRIALVSGVCGGSMAVLASAFDFVLTVKASDGAGSDIYAVSPFVTGVISDPARNGVSAVETEDENDLFATARKLLSYVPSNNAAGPVIIEEIAEPERPANVAGLTGDGLAAMLGDGRDFLRLWAGWSEGLTVGFTSLGGIACAYAISDKTVNDGALTPASMKAAARMIKFADAFGIPMITAVDCPGFSVTEGENHDDAAYLEAAADLVNAVSCAANPRVAAVIGRAYGAGFIYLASKAMGNDVTFALPEACISALSPEASVALVWNDRISDADLSSTREMLETEWKEKLSSPNEAALCGEVDDIVSSDELRARVVSALNMLLGKARTEPVRRRRN